MATPLKRVRGLGAAHRGTETFWRQRVTAVANIPLVIFLILAIVSHIGSSYSEVKAYLASPHRRRGHAGARSLGGNPYAHRA